MRSKDGVSQKDSNYHGLHINAIDGDKLTLPCTDDILKDGYKGTPVKNNQETYYPTMYCCCATDVITGVPVGFSQSKENDEIARAIEIMEKYQTPQKTLTIFDRFYFCSRLLEFYHNSGYFLARCKSGSTFKEITDFIESGKQELEVIIKGIKCRLTRFIVSDAKEETVLITNLPKSFKSSELHRLYGFRWEGETGNRDRTSSIKIEQFHSKNTNGIMQEIWVSLLMQAAGQILCAREVKPELYFMKDEYCKANFKVVFSKLIDSLKNIIDDVKDIWESFKNLILKTIQKRKHYSRSYPRQTNQPLGKQFPRKSLVPRRE